MSASPLIISASRRTDVPALHGQWFLDRLDQGFAEYRNPFSSAIHRVSLKPEDVIGFVFWSKNYLPFFPILDEIHSRGFHFYCQYTITGLDAPLEPALPPLSDRIDCMREISRRFSPDHVVWRFDPIMISTRDSVAATVERFTSLAHELKGCTDECVTSFVQFYPKVLRRLQSLERETAVRVIDLPDEEKCSVLETLATESAQHGMRLSVCCIDRLVAGNVGKAHCVDIERFRRFVPHALPNVPRKGTRKECGCSLSRDIGSYGTCDHHCVYCYANP